MKLTNSTKVLKDIVEKIYQIEYEAQYIPRLLEGWADVLEVSDENDMVEVSKKFVFLLELINEVRDEISNFTKFGIVQTEVDDYLSIINEIDLIFQECNPFTTNVNFPTLKSRIHKSSITTLSLCSNLITSNSQGFYELSPDELEDFQRDISELISEIYESQIDDEVKEFLINKLKELEQLIIDYRREGKIKIRKVSSQVIGDTMLFIQRKNLFSSSLNEKLFKVIDIASKLNGAVTFLEKTANFLPSIVESIVKHLPPGN